MHNAMKTIPLGMSPIARNFPQAHSKVYALHVRCRRPLLTRFSLKAYVSYRRQSGFKAAILVD
jgi:hypothetical protein